MRPTRSRISFAALLVKVTARIFSGATPWRMSSAMRSVMTLVFPAPAPATIRSGPSLWRTARFCASLSPSRCFTPLEVVPSLFIGSVCFDDSSLRPWKKSLLQLLTVHALPLYPDSEFRHHFPVESLHFSFGISPTMPKSTQLAESHGRKAVAEREGRRRG